MQKITSKSLFMSLLLSWATVAHAQQNVITKNNVDRILKALSADDKLGRPAMDPIAMEKSIAFIEGEFKRIGLQPLEGLKGFRQEFSHEMINGYKVDFNANSKEIPSKNVIVYSTRDN